jgi:hypothetical protein
MVQILSSTVSTQSLRPNHVLVQCMRVTTAARKNGRGVRLTIQILLLRNR